MRLLQPAGWPRPKGYSNGVSAKAGGGGRMIFTAGILGWDEKEMFPDYTLHGQFAQALTVTFGQETARLNAGDITCFYTQNDQIDRFG